MTTRHLVDPELLELAETFPSLDLRPDTLPAIRDMSAGMVVLGEPSAFGVTRREVMVPGLGGAPDVRCLVYEPAAKGKDRPAFLHIHGGGYMLGAPEGSDVRNIRVAARLGAVVVSPAYRLAPETRYPGPLDDCAATLAWIVANAVPLGIDVSRIAVGGDSAGGGLAAGLALRARDEGLVRIAFQHLVYPMLDDRTTADDATLDPVLGEFIWTPAANRAGWAAYLGGHTPQAPAVPARASDLSGLPPTWIGIGGLDLFLDENISYARRLIAAGVTTEFIIYPAAYHGFQFELRAAVTQRFEKDYLASLARGLGCDLAAT
ncbi:alpha/beta hydrolase [Hyphomonas johnsonii]|uniref:Arylesterase n=1 Tax=Hyphomonas johnsonii MHS-2 TaxID=1280950 RepID=A0A059FUR6_9PROT|nr:alpha/beta hydrolase [Hyphomonas johnsonii]KCZ94183.1 arylesterase [Hyphomonas johnsonii MHS-2]